MTSIAISIFLGALISVAAIALTILLGVWTYRDAENKGMSGILWTAVVILVPSCIGLIIYLIVRMDNNKVTCSNCNAAVNARNKFCSNCGVELVPVVEVTQGEETFKRSQRNILIGFFASLAAIVILGIFMVACLITGVLGIAGDTVKWITELDVDTALWADTLEDTLGDLDALFDEDEIHVQMKDEEITITGKNGQTLIYIDGRNGLVDVNVKDIRLLLDKYNIEYDDTMSEKEIEERIRKEIKETWKDALEDCDRD